MSITLDRFDRHILRILQEDCSLSSAEMAEKIGLSQSPCWRRLDRLEREGFILKRVAILDRTKLDLSFAVLSQIKIDYSKRTENTKLVDILSSFSEVTECYITIGSTDIFIKVIVRDLIGFQSFILDKLSKIDGITDITSHVLMSEIKNVTNLPI